MLKPVSRKSKKGRINEPTNYNNKGSTNYLHPAFCSKYIQNGFSVKDCSKELQATYATAIEKLCSLTWGAIQLAQRHGSGHEIIRVSSIKVSIPLNTPADRDFLSFRLGSGKNSVFIGYRKDKIFYVVWIDPNGKVYNH